ncbi:DsbA family protein [Candidatus Woesearchaeota archaeon]|nr:DsbA family protein [Candidatus Woesearchaeota archaeon]
MDEKKEEFPEKEPEFEVQEKTNVLKEEANIQEPEPKTAVEEKTAKKKESKPEKHEGKKEENKNEEKNTAHTKQHKQKESTPKKEKESFSLEAPVLWPIISAILLVLLIISIFANPFVGEKTKTLNEEEIKVKAQQFVNTYLLPPGTAATVTSVELNNELYTVTLDVGGQTFQSHMSKDGEIFFPQAALNINDLEEQGIPQQEEQAPAAPPEVPKTDKPVVEMFVMSHCPYGTQVEKGMLPVVELLGNKADIQVKFVNYAMHGKEEVDEQLNQYCIQQEYPDQYYKYLQCFLAEGNTDNCLQEMNFDEETIQTCMDETDAEYGIYADFEDQSTWSGGRFPRFAIHDAENKEYGVQGSPTIVINGKSVNTARDSESLKKAICNAFTTSPEECDTQLPTASPSPGFGFGTSATDSAAANCGV